MNKKKLRQELKDLNDQQYSNKHENLNFTIILVQPEHSGNIGSIARVMKNFDFNNLIIFNPIENIEKILSYETQGYAMHGKDILFNAEIVQIDEDKEPFLEYKKYMERYDLVIATTSRGKDYRNIRRTAIFPQDLSLPLSETALEIAIVFGKESHGLTNKEIELADILLRIPSNVDYRSLNLSHACGIILYEIFKKTHEGKRSSGEIPILLAGKEERTTFYDTINHLINLLKIRTHKKENVYMSFKNVFERAIITKKELSLMWGLFSKVDSILRDLDLYQK